MLKTIPATFYVSPDGSDAWSGKLSVPNLEKTDGPFRSFEKARDAVRAYRATAEFDRQPTVVEFLPGIYHLDKAVKLSDADSGTEGAPVIWRGVCDENGRPQAIVRGGKEIVGGKRVEDAVILKRIKPEVREKVREFDLKALGINDYGLLNGNNTAELFLNNVPMTVSRYPNADFLRIESIDPEDNPEIDIRGVKGFVKPKIIVKDCDMSSWVDEPEVWTLGYWYWDWANERQKMIKIDPDKKMFELDKPYHGYGYRTGQYFFAYHLLCELDVPGEYYIDNDSGKLYFYPPEEVKGDNLFLSMTDTFIEGGNLRHFVLSGIHFEGCRDTALKIHGEDLLLCGCLIRNTGKGGMSVYGSGNLVFGNLLYNLGSHGISLEAGNRAGLVPGMSAVVNNDIHHFGRIQRVYAAGIGAGGCGNLYAQNRITDAPHSAILFGGNDLRFERNEISHVCEESNDAGAIYTGRNWTARGNVVKQNYLHDISGFRGRGCVGVYLDDMLSSVDIVENLFVNVTRAAMIGGGRDNNVVNNIFVDCNPNLHVDARALGWCGDHAEGWLNEDKTRGTLSGIDYKSEPWSKKYPRLAAIMEGNPKAPEGNLIERNLVVSTAWHETAPRVFEGDAVEGRAREYITLRDNVEGDMSLLLQMTQADKAVLPGTDAEFQKIPVEKIGVFQDKNAIAR
jgi:hypothetical protein